jgi:iron complex transport system permease protein
MGVSVAVRPAVRRARLTRAALVLAGGAVLLGIALMAGVGIGSVPIGAGDALAILGHRLLGIGADAGVSTATETILWDLRLPRVLAAMLVGGALACAGAVFQALFRNPLADPYIIGTAAGASLGAVTGIVLPLLIPALGVGAGTAWLGIGLVQLLAFGGGLATVVLVLRLARVGDRIDVVTLLLVGYSVSAVLAAGVALLMFWSGRALSAVFSWLMGSMAGATWIDLAVAAPLVVVAFGSLLLRWRRLNVLLLGDSAAEHLGLDVEREKWALAMLATLTTSAVVAVGGTIGFVGLVVPHLVRLALGPDHRLLLPASLIYGAALLALADLGARLANGIPVGIVTALLGAPFFLYLLRRGRAVAPGRP